MTRDPRMVERKKPGQPKARKNFNLVKDNFIKCTRVHRLVSKICRSKFATAEPADNTVTRK